MEEDALQGAALVVVKELQKREACTSSELAKILKMEESYDLNALLDLLLEKKFIVKLNDTHRKWALPTTSSICPLSSSIGADSVSPTPLTLAQEAPSHVRELFVSRNSMPLTSANDRDFKPFASPPLQAANSLSTGRRQKPIITFPPIPPIHAETSSPPLLASAVPETPIITFPPIPPIPVETSSSPLPASVVPETPIITFKPIPPVPPIPAETSSPITETPIITFKPIPPVPPIPAETSSPITETPVTPQQQQQLNADHWSSKSQTSSERRNPHGTGTPVITFPSVPAESSAPSLPAVVPRSPLTSQQQPQQLNADHLKSPKMNTGNGDRNGGVELSLHIKSRPYSVLHVHCADHWSSKSQTSSGRRNPHDTGMPVITLPPVPAESSAPSLPAVVITFPPVPPESSAPSSPAVVPGSPLTPQQQLQQLNADHWGSPQMTTGDTNRNGGPQRTIKKLSKQKSLSELQLRVLKVLKERGPTRTLHLSKEVGLVTCRDVNPSIYDLQARHMVVKVNDTPTVWQLNEPGPNTTFQTDDDDQS